MSAPTPVVLSEAQAAYLAGLIDGEGHIGISIARGNKSAKGCLGGESHRLNVSVRMTDRGPLDAAAEWTGFGRVVTKAIPQNARRVPYEWIVWSRQAAGVIVAVEPFLIVKKPQARLAIEFQTMMRMPGRNGLSDFEWAERRRIGAEIRSFNYGQENAA